MRIRDGKKSDAGSGINIPDPQHWLFTLLTGRHNRILAHSGSEDWQLKKNSAVDAECCVELFLILVTPKRGKTPGILTGCGLVFLVSSCA